jgi:hypothetical protein
MKDTKSKDSHCWKKYGFHLRLVAISARLRSTKAVQRRDVLVLFALGVLLLFWYFFSVRSPNLYKNLSVGHGTGTTNEAMTSVLYHPARLDRSGSVIYDMLLAHAYAYQNNMTYGGACFADITNGILDSLLVHQSLVDAIGLPHVLHFSCPSNALGSISTIQWVERSTYSRFGTRIWTEEWLEHIRNTQSPPPPIRNSPRAQLVVHIRRGDVSLCDPETTDRYLPNSYYQKLIQEEQQLSTGDMEVTGYAEWNSTEGWKDDDFRSLIQTLRLDASPIEAWKVMMTADVLILSWSSFSIVPAIFNRHGRIVYTPFWIQPLPHWYMVDDDAVRNMKRAKLRLKHELC